MGKGSVHCAVSQGRKLRGNSAPKPDILLNLLRDVQEPSGIGWQLQECSFCWYLQSFACAGGRKFKLHKFLTMSCALCVYQRWGYLPTGLVNPR